MISSYVLGFTKGAVQGVMIIFSFFHPAGKAGGSQIRRCQGIAVKRYGFTLGVLALTPSGFCNVRDYSQNYRLLSLSLNGAVFTNDRSICISTRS
jgi:hypothetical protein